MALSAAGVGAGSAKGDWNHNYDRANIPEEFNVINSGTEVHHAHMHGTNDYAEDQQLHGFFSKR